MTQRIGAGMTVVIPWGVGEVRATALEVEGSEPRVQVVVELTPGLSGYVVDAPTTVTVPLSAVRPLGTAA